MKTVTIEAFDKAGAKLGQRDEAQPETIDELRDQFEDSDIVKLVWRSHVIDIQRELRAEARGPVSKETELVKAFKKLSPAEQAKRLADVA